MLKISQLLRKRKRRIIQPAQDSALEERDDGIRSVVSVLGLILIVLVSLVISMLILTPQFELHHLRQELAETQLLLKKARQREQEALNNYRWMQDPEYFEQIARDRATLALPEEHVIRQAEPNLEPQNPSPTKEPIKQ